jgi:hypothetical protein
MEFGYNEQVAQYEKAQKQAWQDFLLELERLQAEYNATKTEIIDGLKVTRSKFYAFEKDPEQRLNIDRSNILKLWAYLCDTEHRRVPKAARELRKGLKEEGPDKLLAALGFATLSEEKKIGPVGQRPQVRRVLKRLESNWIYDDAVRAYITDNILNQILDLGRPDRKAHMEIVRLNEVETWPQKELGSNETVANEKYVHAIRALIRSGKTNFVRSELFELYQSILEHHELSAGSKAKLRILDCQFKALSQDLSKLSEEVQPRAVHSDDTRIVKRRKGEHEKIDFEDLSKRAERKLVKLLVQNDSGYMLKSVSDEQNATVNIVSTPCLEAEIRCHVLIDGESKPISIRYRSTSTHVENMLRAISHGLGHPLKVSEFSIRATGRTEKSLARISVGLSKADGGSDDNASFLYMEIKNEEEEEKIKEVYQGWWVSSNTITGILSATADAVHRWVNSEDEIDNEKYYTACLDAARISQEFYDLRKALYEYTPHTISSDLKNTFDHKAQKIIEDISQYTDRYGRFDNDGFKIQHQKMRNQKNMTRLVRAHATLIAGKPDDAGKILEQMYLDSLIDESNPYSYVLSVYREACEMAYLFISGGEELTIGKHWKQGNLIETQIEELGKYIRSTQNISFDVYLVISQLYGTVGILDFYSSPSKNDTTLSGYTKSAEYLIQAAHYSLRIGHVRRAVQWLSFASRMCVRLSSIQRAEVLHKLSMSITDQSSSLAVDKIFSLHAAGAKSNWSEMGNLLAEGEIYLLKQDNQAALESFLKALDTALIVGYGRIIPDCLYDISRAARALSTAEDASPFEGINPFFKKWDERDLTLWHKKFGNPKLSIIVVTLIREHLSGKKGKGIELALLAGEAEKRAAEIWNLWKKGGGEHPCAKSIKDRTFLQALHE